MTLAAGIDISHWQSTTPSLAGQAFAFARATYGPYRDDRYAMHAEAVRRAGLVLGAYHFGRNAGINSIASQVSAFLAVAAGADLLAIDLEADRDNPPMTNDQARAFIAAVHARGRRIGLYHSLSGFPALGQDFDWVALWSSTAPARHWDFWQVSGTTLDRDRFRGDVSQLRALIRALSGSTAAPHYHATVKRRTALWNPIRRVWVYNGPNNIRPPQALVIRGAKYAMGQRVCYPIVAGTRFGGYYVPVANVQLGAKAP